MNYDALLAAACEDLDGSPGDAIAAWAVLRIRTLEAALREIAAGLMPEDSAAYRHNRYELCAARLCEIARRAITSETPVKPVCLRDTEAHGKGICEICEDGPCADEPTNNGIYAETWDERMGRKP